MGEYAKIIRNLKSSEGITRLTTLYGRSQGMLLEQTTRYMRMLKKHEEYFTSKKKLYLISAPGRIEIAGNHTDHNNGKVLAASINRDAASIVSKRTDDIINFCSEGYPKIEISLDDIEYRKEEEGTTISLIKGIAFKMKENGYRIGGFDAVCTSTVLSGSGLSSSAAIETLICAIFDVLYNGFKIDSFKRAQIGQFAENKYFGKPSGLLDQSASSIGGLVYVDFKDSTPKIEKLNYDFNSKKYSIVVVDTGSSHDNLTDFYAAIPREMKEIANYFDETCLRRVRPEQVMQNIDVLRKKFGERAVLRAMHFYSENKRVDEQVTALKNDNLDVFLKSIIESGRSSFMYLQNIYALPESQPVSLALSMSENILKTKGAWRVHGGGFAGTTLNIVPHEMVESFVTDMENVFGNNSCSTLAIRPEGAAIIDI